MRRLAVLIGTIVGVVIVAAEPAFADNCGDLVDCLNVLPTALVSLAAALAAALAGWLGSSSGAGGPGSGGPGGSSSGAGSTSGGSGTAPAPPSTAPHVYYPQDRDDPSRRPTPPGVQKQLEDAEKRIFKKLVNNQGPGGKKGWVHDINPTGDQENCVDAAKAVDRTLSGQPTAAKPFNGQVPNQADIEKSYPGREFTDSTLEGITKQVKEGGPGTRGIVHISHEGNGHAVNVYNDGGKVVWIDGQQDIVTNSGSDLLAQDGITSNFTVDFLQTYPP
jgi:hypothetical protein